MKKSFAVLFCLLLVSIAEAQNVRSTATVDSSTYRIGEWIVVHWKAEAPKSFRVVPPSYKDSIGGFDVVQIGEMTQSESGETIEYARDLTLTKFDSGSFTLPPIVTTYFKTNDTTSYTTVAPSITVQVKTISLDSTAAFRDIKDVLHVSLTFWDYLLYFGIVLAVVAIGYFGYRYYKRRPVPEPEPEPEVIIPPHVVALDALQALEAKHLWERGEDKAFQSELTDILRGYLETRYRIPALEMTTNELVQHILTFGLDRELIESLNALLQRADLTKFAKYHPSAMEHQSSMRSAVSIVNSTAPVDEVHIPPANDATQQQGA